MEVLISEQPFDPYAEVLGYEKTLEQGKHGGVVTFVGTMRDFNDGQNVSSMYLDHYPGMTEQHILRVMEEAAASTDIKDAYVVHRVGEIKPAEPIVLVAVWAAHRADAFDACRYIINYLKERAPFWKCETTPQGDKRWVEHNSADPAAAAIGKYKRSA